MFSSLQIKIQYIDKITYNSFTYNAFAEKCEKNRETMYLLNLCLLQAKNLILNKNPPSQKQQGTG